MPMESLCAPYDRSIRSDVSEWRLKSVTVRSLSWLFRYCSTLSLLSLMNSWASRVLSLKNLFRRP
jgi:hypothetical protein